MAEDTESEVLLQTGAAYPAPQYIVDEAYISQKEYERLYKHSIENPEDIQLISLADTADEVVDIINKFYSEYLLSPNF